MIEGALDARALVLLQRSLIASPELLVAYRATNHDIGQAPLAFLDHWESGLMSPALELTMLCPGETFRTLQDFALSRDATCRGSCHGAEADFDRQTNTARGKSVTEELSKLSLELQEHVYWPICRLCFIPASK